MKTRLYIFPLLLAVLLAAHPAGGQTQYRQALPGYRYQFPRDHFAHPEYATEWWYYTGNLRDAHGRRFGFELTFFRQAITSAPAKNAWSIQDVYMAHLALSDIATGHFLTEERLNRAGPGIAGIDAGSARIWNGNWQVILKPGSHQLTGVGDNFSIQLNLAPLTPPVIHGRDGISQKAEGAGHASQYISFPRLRTKGRLMVDGKTFTVEGDSWMDHEFFTDSMGANEIGWDWLSLQLDDNTELMLYRLRHRDGSADPYSSGTLINAAGVARHLTREEFSMDPAGTTWQSPETDARYPLGWSVEVPSAGLSLQVTTPLASQELVNRVGPSYWEGAIDISGHRNAAPIHGSGYLEMTGYAAEGH